MASTKLLHFIPWMLLSKMLPLIFFFLGNDFFKENSLVAMTFTMSASMGNSNQTLRSIN